MGVMIDGRYQVEEPAPRTDAAGRYQRARSTLRHWITTGGGPGPTGDGGFVAESGRYHLFVSWSCPWAHRALLARVVLGLEDAITVSFAEPRRDEQGWIYSKSGEFSDPLLGIRALHQVYSRGAAAYTGRVTVPVLWDKKTETIVNNESADIVRMLCQAFAAPGGPDLYPAAHRDEIDGWNERIYANVNNGVYRAGFARTQEAYDEAVAQVFENLEAIDAHLAARDWLAGETFTEADLRLFPTLARFDVAYHYAFKCNLKRLTDFPNLWPYARRIYHMPGIAGTVRFDICKRGYFSKSELRNPLGIVPAGPVVDWPPV